MAASAHLFSFSSKTSLSLSPCQISSLSTSINKSISISSLNFSSSNGSALSFYTRPVKPSHICKMGEYMFPKPIPAFAEAETVKFKNHMIWRLKKKRKEYFGKSLPQIIYICTKIFRKFLLTEYGGPGTLLVFPFCDMANTLRAKGLPGAAQAARAAVVWAQNNVDKDWKEWVGEDEEEHVWSGNENVAADDDDDDDDE